MISASPARVCTVSSESEMTVVGNCGSLLGCDEGLTEWSKPDVTCTSFKISK